jgi:hypothetical protein
MSSSRRSRLPPRPDRRRPAGVSPSASTRVATFLLLLAGGVVVLLFAMRLTAAAFDCDFSPFAYLGLPADSGLRAWLLAGAIVVLGLLVWLVARHGEETFWLAGVHGGVLVPAAPVVRTVEAAAARHPEVVRAEANLRAFGAGLGGTIRVYGRPLADPTRLSAEVEPLVRRRLRTVTGVEPGDLVIRPRILRVPELKKYLP